MKKCTLLIGLIIISGIELDACSFLRRYGANSYITNIPLFFKRQDPEAPQRKGDDQVDIGQEIIEEKIMDKNVETAVEVQDKQEKPVNN